MTVLNLLLGRPLASDEALAECVGAAAGIPIFGPDALSSATYGPEAALTLLIPLGAAGVAYMIPISASIIALLAIVYFSYRRRSTPIWRTEDPHGRPPESGSDCGAAGPELVQRRWYHHLLHNKPASVLKALLLLKGNHRIMVINVHWYLES